MIDLSDLPWVLVDLSADKLATQRLQLRADIEFATYVVQPAVHEVVERVVTGRGDRRDVPVLQAIGWKVGKVDLPFRPAKPHTQRIPVT